MISLLAAEELLRLNPRETFPLIWVALMRICSWGVFLSEGLLLRGGENLNVFLRVYDFQLLQGLFGVSDIATAQHCQDFALHFTFQELYVRGGENGETHEAVTVLRLQEFLSCCKHLNSVVVWWRWPFLIRAGDNNELVCPVLITDSTLFSFPIHKYRVIINGQWHLLVIIMFAYSVEKMFKLYWFLEL